MTTDKRKVERALLAKGFKQSDKGHHYFIYFAQNGKKSPFKTMTSHSPREKSLDAARLKQMAQQCGLDTTQFRDLIECPLSREDYESFLTSQGLI